MTSIKHPSRRDFLSQAAAAGGGAVTMPRLLAGGMLSAAGLAAGCESATSRPGQSSWPDLATLPIPTGPTDDAWAAVRAHFILQPGTAYMNNASLGMPPGVVAEAVADGYLAISTEPLHGKHDLQDRIAQTVMPSLAQTFGADISEISLTRNATEALHLQTLSLDLSPGDEVLITTHEHPAGHRPWMVRAARHGVTVREVFIPSPLVSVEDVISRFEAEITNRTRAIAFCHVTRGGHRYPVRELCTFARERGLVSLVDGAQAVGQFPIDLHELGCDAYSASMHKWMFGPVGTGFLYVRSGARDGFSPAFEPGGAATGAEYAPPGTADFPVRAALATSLAFVERIRLANVEARCRHLSDYLKGRLAKLDGCTLLSGPEHLSAPGSTIFELAGLDAVASVPRLEELARTHIDEHQRDGHDAIRVSTHVYNTKSEIDRLVDGLEAARGL